jgi:hypothetical protein
VAYLSLTLNSLSVAITTFVGESYPRLLYAAPKLDYTQHRNLVANGFPFVPPETWVVSCFLTVDEADTLDAIYREHLRLKEVSAQPRLTVIDTTWRYKELAPRTKAVAPPPYDVIKTLGTGNTHVSYFARFYAYFLAEPKFTEAGDHVTCSFSLSETDENIAP